MTPAQSLQQSADHFAHEDRIIELVRENEKLRQALKSCRTYAEQCSFGAWRFVISGLCNSVLGNR